MPLIIATFSHQEAWEGTNDYDLHPSGRQQDRHGRLEQLFDSLHIHNFQLAQDMVPAVHFDWLHLEAIHFADIDAVVKREQYDCRIGWICVVKHVF